MHRRPTAISRTLIAVLLLGSAAARAQTPAAAQTPPPGASLAQLPAPAGITIERVTFDEAVRRALENNPTFAQAAQNVLRAEALLQQARAATRPALSASFSNVLINEQRGFEGIVAQPRNQAFLGLNASMPILAAAQWAAAAQARDQVAVAQLSTTDVGRQIAVAAGQAYLAVLNQARQVEVNARAREAALAHLDYAQRRLAAGAGSRLNELRAAQEASADEARLENSRLAVRQAQEALGVLMGARGPVDAAGEPTFEVPPVALENDDWLAARTDIQLSTATLIAAERVAHDSSKDWFPTARASFDPQYVTPAGSFSPSGSWSFTVTASQPLWDSGQRRALLRLRTSDVAASRLALTNTQLQARSEARLADESVRSAERALTSLRQAAEQAAEVLQITTTAFEAGATTNLEVIDAQRSARDAESAVAVGEDALRRARLDLLVAIGQFPR